MTADERRYGQRQLPREGTALVEFCGQHDLAIEEDTGALLERLVAENVRVVVDLCSATFSPNIAAAFLVSGVSEHLSVVATLDEALA